jgi:hypothetical protein
MSFIPSKTNPLTAFGELSVAQPSTVLQVQFPYNINDEVFTTGSVGSGFLSHSQGKAIVATGTTPGSSASCSTKVALHYAPGQGVDIRFTALFTSGVAGSQQRVGFGDESDGFFFGYSGSNFGVLRKREGVDNWTFQQNWGTDVMDGTGPSRVNLDKTKGNVYRIQFQWLGFGAINYFVENPSTGEFTLVNREAYANANTIPSIINPTLPLLLFVSNSSNTSNVQVEVSSMAAFIEGAMAAPTIRNAASGSKTITAKQNVMTIRNNSTFLGKQNRVRVFPDFVSATADGTKDVEFTLVLNGTLGGSSSFTEVNSNTSVVSVDTAGTTVTGGKTLIQFEVAKASSDKFFLKDFFITLNPGETLSITAESASSSDVVTSLSWQEQF